VNTVEIRPYSFRIPSNGEHDPFFGCTRTFWAERCRATPVKPADVQSFVVRRAGDKRGIRLIDYESARAWMERQRQGNEHQGNGKVHSSDLHSLDVHSPAVSEEVAA